MYSIREAIWGPVGYCSSSTCDRKNAPLLEGTDSETIKRTSYQKENLRMRELLKTAEKAFQLLQLHLLRLIILPQSPQGRWQYCFRFFLPCYVPHPKVNQNSNLLLAKFLGHLSKFNCNYSLSSTLKFIPNKIIIFFLVLY